jgi:hypothetical protein
LTTTLNVLDVAIGLVVVYLLLSLICSSVNEGIESLLKNRARQLERGIREILSDPEGTQLAHLVYNHPLISGLFQGQYNPAQLRKSWWGRGKVYAQKNLPSYMPAANFALAVLDIVLPATKEQPGGAAGSLQPLGAATADSGVALRHAALNFPVPEVSRALVILIDASGRDVTRVRLSIEAWFNSTMDRVSGWYKRRTQIILFAVGLAMAATLNIDTVDTCNHLVSDPSLRSSLVATAQEYAKNETLSGQRAAVPAPAGAEDQGNRSADRVEQNLSRLHALGVPIGWSKAPQDGYHWFLKIAGILASALAAALGAPFWFDILNRFVVVRSTIKPKEKSQEEKSKD